MPSAVLLLFMLWQEKRIKRRTSGSSLNLFRMVFLTDLNLSEQPVACFPAYPSIARNSQKKQEQGTKNKEQRKKRKEGRGKGILTLLFTLYSLLFAPCSLLLAPCSFVFALLFLLFSKRMQKYAVLPESPADSAIISRRRRVNWLWGRMPGNGEWRSVVASPA